MEYQHGGDIYSQEIEMDYSANLNPWGMPRGVKEAVKNHLEEFALYPDSQCRRLKAALVRHYQEAGQEIQESQLICGNGAADLIFQLAYALKPAKAMVLAPGFGEYEQALLAAGCKTEHYMLAEEEGFAFCPERLAEELLKRTKEQLPEILFICNPNNPTGLAVSGSRLKILADVCKKLEILLAADECFHEFLENPEEYSLVSEVRENKCLFILKAFTKIYAMAGIRLGYGISSNEELLEKMREKTQPWSVSSIAQIAGEAALNEKEYVKASVCEIQTEREILKEKLRSMGFEVYESMANYIFFKDTKQKKESEYSSLYENLRKNKVLIRSCKNYVGLDSRFYRICVKSREENEKLLMKIKEVREAQ